MMSQDRSKNLIRAFGLIIALIISITPWSNAAMAAGESCDLFSPCASGKDYCSAPEVSPRISRRSSAGNECIMIARNPLVEVGRADGREQLVERIAAAVQCQQQTSQE